MGRRLGPERQERDQRGLLDGFRLRRRRRREEELRGRGLDQVGVHLAGEVVLRQVRQVQSVVLALRSGGRLPFVLDGEVLVEGAWMAGLVCRNLMSYHP